jgi:outer membrane protein TolC
MFTREILELAPDIQKVRLQAEQAELHRRLEKGTGMLRPDLFVNLGMEVSGQKVPGLNSNWLKDWDVNFTFTLGTRLTVWDSGSSFARRRQTGTSAKIAREGYQLALERVGMELRVALKSLEYAFQFVQEQEVSAELSREQFKNATVSYENQLATRAEVLGAEAAWRQAEISLLSALLEFQLLKAEVEALAGFPIFSNPEFMDSLPASSR